MGLLDTFITASVVASAAANAKEQDVNYHPETDYSYDLNIDWDALAVIVHADNVRKGFWPPEGRNFGEMLALAHSELSEAFDDWEHLRAPDEKVPQYCNTFVEIADCMIRLLDTMGHVKGSVKDLNVEDYRESDYGVSQYKSMGENLMLINSKLSGALEANRKLGETQGFLEDAFMLCWALLVEHNQDAQGIIDAKLAYNRSRPFKHGKSY